MTYSYYTSGNVRGRCPHKHRSADSAEACRARDAEGCASQGGYSDREVYRSDGALMVWDGSSWYTREELDAIEMGWPMEVDS